MAASMLELARRSMEEKPRVAMHPSENSLRRGGHFRAREIDFAIARHQQLQSFNPGIVRGNRATLMDIFIRKVLNRVAENLQRPACRLADLPPAMRPGLGSIDIPPHRRSRNTRHRSGHLFFLTAPHIERTAPYLQMTKVLISLMNNELLQVFFMN